MGPKGLKFAVCDDDLKFFSVSRAGLDLYDPRCWSEGRDGRGEVGNLLATKVAAGP